MSNLDPVKAKQADNSNKLQNQTLPEIQKLESGNFIGTLEGVEFTGIYIKCGKQIQYDVDVNVGSITNFEYTLSTNLPFAVHSASGFAMAQVGPWAQCWCRLIAIDKRLVLYINNTYANPITVQGSVTCFIK